jgi:short-subunit dehydrogenase
MAGSSQRGRAHEMGVEADAALMQLNCLAPMALTKVSLSTLSTLSAGVYPSSLSNASPPCRAQAVLPSMLARRAGHVVLISSMVCANLTQACVNLTQACVNLTQVCVDLTQAARIPSPGQATYAAAKAAVSAYHHTLHVRCPPTRPHIQREREVTDDYHSMEFPPSSGLFHR